MVGLAPNEQSVVLYKVLFADVRKAYTVYLAACCGVDIGAFASNTSDVVLQIDV